MLPLANALSKGFSSKQIIDFLLRKFPEHSGKINKALASGFTIEQILKFLGNGRKGVNQEDLGPKTEHSATREIDLQRTQNVNKGATALGTLAATSLAAPMAASALQRALPSNLSSLIPDLTGQNQGGQVPPSTNLPMQMPTQMQQSQQAQQPPVNQVGINIPQAAPQVQPEVNTVQEEIGKGGWGKKIKELASAGNGSEQIAGYLHKFHSKETKELEARAKKPIQEIVTQFLSQQAKPQEQAPIQENVSTTVPTEKMPNVPIAQIKDKKQEIQNLKVGDKFKTRRGEIATITKINEKGFEFKSPTETRSGPLSSLENEYEGKEDAQAAPEQPQVSAPVEPVSKELDEATEAQQEPQKLEKGATVATPQGVGEIKAIKEKSALVEVDGKVHKVPVDELEKPSFSDDEVADAYDNIMAKIPEEHRSGFISWAGYDENRNVLGFIPRGGKYEELENISPTEAHIIKEGVGTARTSGENREGLWVVGEDTRGGLISQIIHDRRRKRESEEKKQLKFDFGLPKPEKEDKGMKPIFDEMAYARNLSRDRERKKKIEEREKKKKEKDEAKKRKK